MLLVFEYGHCSVERCVTIFTAYYTTWKQFPSSKHKNRKSRKSKRWPQQLFFCCIYLMKAHKIFWHKQELKSTIFLTDDLIEAQHKLTHFQWKKGQKLKTFVKKNQTLYIKNNKMPKFKRPDIFITHTYIYIHLPFNFASWRIALKSLCQVK